MPDYEKLMEFSNFKTSNLYRVYSSFATQSQSGFNLLQELLSYDPEKRISSENALDHPYFKEMPIPTEK
jgi:cell division cycle 2-like protein